LDIEKDFFEHGLVIRRTPHEDLLNRILEAIGEILEDLLEKPLPVDINVFLEKTHKYIPVNRLNTLRLEVYKQLNSLEWFRDAYYEIGKFILDVLVGDELAMQNRINLSIQYPGDNSSLLAIHSDAFSGETPFQVVMWMPLMDVSGTQSMFKIPPKLSFNSIENLRDFRSTLELQNAHESKMEFVTVRKGEIMIFSPNILHGNVSNKEMISRWSFNVRFKSIWSPYSEIDGNEKKLGSFYVPYRLKPLTKFGLRWQEPLPFQR
jgi:sporadic carbohydrate cluster 2OG-Fe(II) oxygenase